MPYPAGDLLHITIGGAMAADRWQIGIWQTISGMTSNPTATQLNTDAAGVGASWMAQVWSTAGSQPLKAFNAPATSCDVVRESVYRNGVLTQSGSAALTPIVGTGASPHPGYTCMVYTLGTATSGRSFRGRLYLPWTGGGINGSNLQNASTLSVFTGNMKAFLDALNTTDINLPGTPTLRVVVLSKHLASSAPVTTVKVDSKFDTQRGRQNKAIAAAVAVSTLA